MELWKVSQEIYERIIKAMYMKYGEKQDWRDMCMVWCGVVWCGVHCVSCAVCVVVGEIWCFLFWVLCFYVSIFIILLSYFSIFSSVPDQFCLKFTLYRDWPGKNIFFSYFLIILILNSKLSSYLFHRKISSLFFIVNY